jgi:hypothetical protein
VVRRHLNRWALLQLLAVSGALAQPASLSDLSAERADCASVVIVRCERPAAESQLGTSDQARQQSRRSEPRRQSSIMQQLEGIVIEGEALRRRSIEEMMNIAPPLRARDGNYTFETGEGTKCTCMNVCPPWPLPCCTCSGHMSRYRLTPGSSPIN